MVFLASLGSESTVQELSPEDGAAVFFTEDFVRSRVCGVDTEDVDSGA